MKRFFLMPFVLLMRGWRLITNPGPFVLLCEGHPYTISHHGRSLDEVKQRFFEYYKNALICPGCGRVLLPGEKVSRHGHSGVAHYDDFCVENPDYLGVINNDGRVKWAYPNDKSCNEMAECARKAKAHDM